MNIRPVDCERDIAAILAIYTPFVLHSPVTFETEVPSFQAFETRVRQIAVKFPYLVAEDNGEILGYAYAGTHRERVAYRWCVETSIYMAEAARGKGLGKRLYNTLLQELRKRNFTLAYGIITQPNEASVALHTACGFTPMALHRNAGFKQGWHDVLWMENELNPCLQEPPEPFFGPAENFPFTFPG